MSKKLSGDELRQKIDGFSTEKENKESHDDSYITTDQGVYYPPDSYIDKTKKKNEK